MNKASTFRGIFIAVSTLGLFAIGAACSADPSPSSSSGSSVGDSGGTSGATSSGSSGGTSGTGTSGGTSGDASGGLSTTAYSEAFCTRIEKCLPGRVAINYGDRAGCVSYLSKGFTERLTLDGVSVAQSQLDACRAKLDTAPCDVATNEIPECILKGTLANGMACGNNTQCLSASCVKTRTGGTDATCGKCTALATLGSDCSAAVCDANLECDGSQKCVARPALGAACIEAGPSCQSGLRCIATKCATPVAKGGACTRRECSVELACLANNTCGDAIVFRTVEIGEKCGKVGDEFVFCRGFSCTGEAPNLTCVARAKVGELCGDGRPNPSCELGLKCVNATCIKEDLSACK